MSENNPESTGIEAMTCFLIVVDRSGQTVVFGDDFPEVTVDHIANLGDVETFASQASREAGRLIQQAMVEAAQQPAEGVSSRVGKALKKRKAKDGD